MFDFRARRREGGGREREGQGERDRDVINIDWLYPKVPIGESNPQPVRPDWELNLQPFGVQDNTPTN